ncbi:MAG: hypothetical protein ACREDM_10500 [Methylocella sp.]
MIADGDQQPGVPILRTVQTAEGEVEESDERKKLFRRRYRNSEFDSFAGRSHVAHHKKDFFQTQIDLTLIIMAAKLGVKLPPLPTTAPTTMPPSAPRKNLDLIA